MGDTKSIMSLNEYGKINICLKDILDSRGMTRNSLARALNTRFEVINKWYNNDVEKMDLDILARICYVLECSPEDIIKYECKYNTAVFYKRLCFLMFQKLISAA